MIDFIFTVDYEIYGNGTGALRDLVYEPMVQLRNIFESRNARFVVFVEVAEFEKIEAHGTDPAIDLVTQQVRELHQNGFEVGLHLHPQWCNAQFDRGHWVLDYSEYNLCKLSRSRIAEIIDGSLDYLRHVVDQPGFTPLSFRAGNWLFQPTEAAAEILSEKGIRIDSSVFKGGLQHNHGLDYRRALGNGYYWFFNNDVNEPDPTGPWLELPIHSETVPLWRVPTSKRMSFGNNFGMGGGSIWRKLNRARDFLRFRYPLKLDFCRMNLGELKSMVERVIKADQKDPASYRPIVTIGHTKDLTDLQTVDSFLAFLMAECIPVSTFEQVYPKILQRAQRPFTVLHAPQSRTSEVV